MTHHTMLLKERNGRQTKMRLQFIIKSLTDCYSHLSEDDAVRYLYWPLAKVALVSLVELGCLSYGDILCRLGQQQTLEAEESTLQQVTALEYWCLNSFKVWIERNNNDTLDLLQLVMQTRHSLFESRVCSCSLYPFVSHLYSPPLLSLPLSEISFFAVNHSTGSSVEEQSGSISITVGISEKGQGSNLVL